MCYIKSAVIEQISVDTHVEKQININNDCALPAEAEVIVPKKILRKRKLKGKNTVNKRKKIEEREMSLAQAARTGKVKAIRKILSREDVDINEQVVGCTALHYAAFYNHLEVVKLLVEKEAEIDLQNTAGITPICWAVENGNKEIVLYLLDKCDPSIADNNGFTPLHKAVSKGNLEIASILLSCNTEEEIWVNIDDVTKEEKYSPLHTAIMKGYLDVAKFLIEKKANVELKSRSGASPLHYAICKADSDFIDYLIRNRADVNSLDANDRTPLHWACIYSKFDFVKLLLDNGATRDVKDVNSCTPLDLANDESVIELLNNYYPLSVVQSEL